MPQQTAQQVREAMLKAGNPFAPPAVELNYIRDHFVVSAGLFARIPPRTRSQIPGAPSRCVRCVPMATQTPLSPAPEQNRSLWRQCRWQLNGNGE
jgi:hypothetical protein